MIGTTEIVVIAATGMILFGASAIPKFARSIGQAKKELEKGMKEGYEKEDEDVTAAVEETAESKSSKKRKVKA